MVLRERDMLVGGGMEDEIRPRLLEEPQRARAFGDVLEGRPATEQGESTSDPAIDLEECVLAPIHHHQLGRVEFRDRLAEGAADRSPRPRHEDATSTA